MCIRRKNADSEDRQMKNIAILGASDNPDCYAYLAQVKLQEHGYPVYPVSKSGKDILGVRKLLLFVCLLINGRELLNSSKLANSICGLDL